MISEETIALIAGRVPPPVATFLLTSERSAEAIVAQQRRLVVEIKGYRREDAREKKTTMETYWVPGVNRVGAYGRWAFAEFTEMYEIEADFEARVAAEFGRMIEKAASA